MNKKKKSRLIRKIVSVLIFLAGLGIFLYPTISDAYGKYRDSKLKVKYNTAINSMESSNREKELEDAERYNENLIAKNRQIVSGMQFKPKDEDRTEENDEYESLLSSSAAGLMGYLDIPKLAVSLPLYHYTDDEVLNKGIGHMHGSSLPVGGEGTHAIFIGHRGLPSLKLFSDLDEMKKGDTFYIHVLDRILAYRVFSVDVVLPTEVDSLRIEDGRDLVTLVTCTPYGVNTHRILVRAERTEYKGEDTEPSMMNKIKRTIDNKTILGLAVILIAIIILVLVNRDKKPEKVQDNAPDMTDRHTEENGSPADAGDKES